MKNQSKANIEYALKWGVIFGMVNVLIYLLVYLIEKSLLVNMWFSITVFFINLFLLVYPLVSKRKELGGIISFNDAFLICFIIFLGGILIQNIFNYILYNFIDTGLAEYIKQKAIESALSMMEKFGAPQDKIDETLTKLQNEDFSQTPTRISKQFLFSILFGGAISLIIAAIFKRNPKDTNFE